MNSRQLVHAALNGDATPRAACGPLAVHYCARHAGVSMREYTLDARKLADCVIAYYEAFRPDAVWVSSDTWVTAEAMGAAVEFQGDDQPMGGALSPTVRTVEDVTRIPDPDPASRGRQPIMLEALRLVKRAIGDEAFIVACLDQSPFSLACALAGAAETLIASITDPEFLDALLARCVDHAAAYGEALAACGADMLSTGDSPVIMLGAERYRDMALPYEQRLFGRLRRTASCKLSLHICGDATELLPHMARSGADVLEVDATVDISAACKAVPDRIALWGNIDPVRVLFLGTQSEVQSTCDSVLDAIETTGRTRFVLSSGCTLAPNTPPENISAMIDATKARRG